MGDGLTKACLRVVEGKATPSELSFSFNPSEYSIAKSSTWSRPTTKGAKSSGKAEFGGANPQTLQMEIFFDAWGGGGTEGVAQKVATLLNWVKPTDESVDKKSPRPPILTFEWGSNSALTGFRGYLKSVTAKYLLFDLKGNPTRATATVTLEEAPVPAPKTNPTSGGPAGRRIHVVRDGDSLQSIAYAEFEDPSYWRSIAEYNGLDDPFRVRAGTALRIPNPIEAARLR